MLKLQLIMWQFETMSDDVMNSTTFCMYCRLNDFNMNAIYYTIISDVDECVEEPCPENSDCVNQEGSYECQCHEGYVMYNSVCEGNYLYDGTVHIHQ